MKDSGKMIKRKTMESKNSPMGASTKDITPRASPKEKGLLTGVTDRLTRASGGGASDTALAHGKEPTGRYTKANGGTASPMGQGLLPATATPMKGNSDNHLKMASGSKSLRMETSIEGIM
jgi:hypothetical protein